MLRSRVAAALALLLPAATAGCFLLAAGAGAGGGIYVTTRGVESLARAPVERLFEATEEAFRELEIERTELRVEGEGERREVRGRDAAGSRDVTVRLEREGEASTHVEVHARTGPVTWDKDYARRVLDRILEKVG